MAANVYLTLADWGRRVNPDGNIDDMAATLSQCNDIFKDMLWRESNLPTSHRVTVQTGLPQGIWRRINQGVPFTKGTSAQAEFGIGMLEDYSRVDKKLAELNGNEGAFRMQEDNMHLEGLSQQMASALFYANSSVNPERPTGFATMYNTVSTSNAQNAVNVLDAGGTASANASIWGIGWGDMTTFGIFPKGSKAGLIFENKGDIRPAFDSNSNEYEAYTSYFKWEAGLCVKDWRYNFRIANLDTTTAGLKGVTPPDIFALIAQAFLQVPTMTKRSSGITETDAPDEVSPGTNFALYTNRTVRAFMDIQAIRDKNVLISLHEYAGEPTMMYRDVPIRVVDALLNTEARVV